MENRIVGIFRENPLKSYSLKTLVRELGGSRLRQDEREYVAEFLQQLVTDQEIVASPDDPFVFNLKELPRVEGRVVTLVNSGGFVAAEGYDEDIKVARHDMLNALVDDKVEVAVYRSVRKERIEGVVTRIIERAKKNYIGVVERNERFAFVTVDSKDMLYDIFVPLRDLNGAASGDKVVVEVVDFPPSSNNPVGRVLRTLGRAGDNEVEMHAILEEFGLPYEFPKEVLAASEAIPDVITEKDYRRRRDFRGVTTFTIDPFDAKDFDDALSCRKLENGRWEVGIHIADVSHYVTEGSVLDEEAQKRATSVYLVDRVVPMLPERLSNGLCSLRPQEEKLCFSAVFELDGNAAIHKEWFGRTVIYSDRRFTYEEAQQIIESGKGDLSDEVLQLHKLAQILRRERFRNGSIAFERDEPKFRLDEKGHPLGVYFKQQKESNQLVEEFMLLANKQVANFIATGKKGKQEAKTFVYRVHGMPNSDKFTAFTQFAARFGYNLRAKNDASIAREINKLLGAVKGKREENLLTLLALRTMAKAVYTTDNIGHYGLAFNAYSHFTSPIRRYPDVMLHRLLQRYLDGAPSADKQYYEQLCDYATQQEIRATEAERASIKLKMVEFLQDRIGEEFLGTISGVAEWGIYVELDETKIEGMVPAREMRDDDYAFDAENYRYVGSRTGRTLTLGDRVRIRVARVDLKRKLIDYQLIGYVHYDTQQEESLEEPRRNSRRK